MIIKIILRNCSDFLLTKVRISFNQSTFMANPKQISVLLINLCNSIKQFADHSLHLYISSFS